MTGSSGAKPKIRVVVDADSGIADIVPMFLEHVQEDLAAMHQALDRADYETIRILGHSLMGAGGGFGFDPISDIGLTLEAASGGQDAETVRASLDRLADYVERVELVYE